MLALVSLTAIGVSCAFSTDWRPRSRSASDFQGTNQIRVRSLLLTRQGCPAYEQDFHLALFRLRFDTDFLLYLRSLAADRLRVSDANQI